MSKNRKEEYLIKKVSPFNVYKVKNIDDVLKSLKKCGFQGRNLGRALDIFYKMVTDKEILTILTLSGAMVPAGMGDLICALIEHHLIDVIITTGATISHDLVDAFTNGGHYIGNSNADDNELFKHRINRIYDVYLPENNYINTERKLLGVIERVFSKKTIHMIPSDFLEKVGNSIEERCILSLAAKYNVPIFVPAFSDSEFALDLIIYSIQEGFNFQFDILGDVRKFGEIIKNSKKTGTLIVGGGVPRNWAQQIFPFLDQLERIKNFGYDYSVRIHTATEYDGGLSGCTISESKSWGKYSLTARSVSVWCDATIALPLLITGVLQRLEII